MGIKAASNPDMAKMINKTAFSHSFAPGAAVGAPGDCASAPWSSTSPPTIKIRSGRIFATAKKLLTFAPARTPMMFTAANAPISTKRTTPRTTRVCAAGKKPPRYSTKMFAFAAPDVSRTSQVSHAI